jgi:hypothetical protein
VRAAKPLPALSDGIFLKSMSRCTELFWVFPVAVLLAAGCGGAAKTAPVSGTVTYKGKAVPNAHVTFAPEDGRRAAEGVTDQGGRFALGTFTTNDGALIGKHRVNIIARGPDRPPKPGESSSGMPGETMPGDPVIPQKYFAPDTSGLTFEVKPGSNRADFELKD